MTEGVEQFYCVVELNGVGGPAVWGVGESTEEAIGEAVKWASAFSMHHAGYDIEDAEDMQKDPRFHVYPCSHKVYRQVEEYGGEIEFVIENGRVVLPKEVKSEMADKIPKRNMRTVVCEKHGQWHMQDLYECPICLDERFAGLPRTPLGPCRIREELVPNKVYGPGVEDAETASGENNKPEQLSLF